MTKALRIWNGGGANAHTTPTRWPDGRLLDYPTSVMIHYEQLRTLPDK